MRDATWDFHSVTAQAIRLHADTHLLDGSDPLVTATWGYWSGSAQTITSPAAGAGKPINMTVFATNDESTYAMGAGSGGFAGFNGPSVLRPGVYRSTHSYSLITATTNDVIGCHFVDQGFGIMPHTAMAGWTTVVFTPPVSGGDTLETENTLRFQLLHFLWGPFDPGHLAAIPAVMIETAYSFGGHTFTVEFCQVLIERLARDYTNPNPGFP